MLMGQGFMVSTVSRYFFLHPQPGTAATNALPHGAVQVNSTTRLQPASTVATATACGDGRPRSSAASLPRPQANAHQATSRYLAAFAY